MRVSYDEGMRQEAKKTDNGLMTVQVQYSDGGRITIQGVYGDKILEDVFTFACKKSRLEDISHD